MLTYGGVVALGWDAQRQAHQLLQSQRHHQQLYGSLLAAAAAAAVSQRAMIAQRQPAHTAAVSEDRPLKKTPGIWSPATDIENNNNNNNGKPSGCSSYSSSAVKWETDSDQAEITYYSSLFANTVESKKDVHLFQEINLNVALN